MQNELQTTDAGKLPGRWTLIRDIAVLQGKLIIDGLRDFILVPVSIAAGIVSLLKTGGGPGTEFYDLLRVGRSTERWINLFGAADRVHGRVRDEDISPSLTSTNWSSASSHILWRSTKVAALHGRPKIGWIKHSTFCIRAFEARNLNNCGY